MRWTRDYKPQPEVKKLYNRALLVTVGGNIFLAVIKVIVAVISGSAALFADAANSSSDVIYSILMVLGLWAAQRPPDISHPQGHRRFEPLVGLAVTISMGLSGFLAARNAYIRFSEGGQAIEPGLPIVVLLLSAAMKVGMFLAIRTIAKKLLSPTLHTTAQDNLSDVLTSLAAFVGVVGSSLINPLVDPIAGFVVAAWIFRAAFNAARDNLGFLTGAGASEELRLHIVEIAEGVPGVVRVHHTMADYVGPALMVDLHINVDGKMTLNEAHTISDEVIKRLEAMPEVDRAYVHIEPHDWQD
ncbi:MAG: cation transporter [Anaerolineaceae bacterium]|nr:cation transporter [Anaerolineaceae bacterium]